MAALSAIRREEKAPAGAGALGLRAEVLAAALAAGAQDLAATGGRLAGEETVATGAYEVRRLESPLHRIVLKK